MEVLPINHSRFGAPAVRWIGRQPQQSWDHALDLLGDPGTECLVAAVRHDPGSAFKLLTEAKAHDMPMPVILLLEPYESLLAHKLRRAGAYEVLDAGVEAEELNAIIAQARAAYRALLPQPQAAPWRHNLVGRCAAIERLGEAISLIAERRSTVLITGETGTGKEVVARAIHQGSGRKGALITLNCTALPESLLEAELFGHTKGAFTGAQQARAGRFEAAHKGTIFLDEIGDMPLDLQAKLLRVLQEREIQRLGSSETIPIDVRVIAATNADLLSKVEDGRFREDLYFRLNVVPVHLPPLRERHGDLPLLAQHFVVKICKLEDIPAKTLTRAALERLELHHWPGNIRELENTIERAIALSGRREELLPADFLLPVPLKKPAAALPELSHLTLPESGLDFEGIIAGIERTMIEQALRRTNGNKSAAAELLGLKRTTLGAKMRTLGTGDQMRALSA
ncbi:MAG: sigma-54 dependent transcriptional regulator [Bryobacter sp.]|jgi:DNA-binding NtrC family response regulator|nr:sigma-54 dependent transcriptional regulator [Bryobacter sp. CoA8 C33]